MKNTIKLLLVLFTLTTLVFVACQKDDSSSNNKTTTSSITGSWERNFVFDSTGNTKIIMNINTNKSYNFVVDSNVLENGSYSITDNTITFSECGSGKYDFMITNGTSLKMTLVSDTCSGGERATAVSGTWTKK